MYQAPASTLYWAWNHPVRVAFRVAGESDERLLERLGDLAATLDPVPASVLDDASAVFAWRAALASIGRWHSESTPDHELADSRLGVSIGSGEATETFRVADSERARR
jgi:hypothetical protein